MPKAVILAGGLGTRLAEETERAPSRWSRSAASRSLAHHEDLSAHGVNDFVVCLGYKGYIIKEYFANYYLHKSDVTFDLGANAMEVHHRSAEPWRVTLVDTGEDHDRRAAARGAEYLDDDIFCMTYGDGVSASTSVACRLSQHERPAGDGDGRASAGTLRRARARRRQGAKLSREAAGDGGWINGGFFVCRPRSSTSSTATPPSGSGTDGGLRGKASSAPIATTASGSRWTRCATSGTSRSCGRREGALEGLVSPSAAFWRDRRVLVTGHTGFKGAWLASGCSRLGARVTGFALAPETSPSLFKLAGSPSAWIRTSATSAISRHACDAVVAESRPRSCSTWPRRRWCARSYADPSPPSRPT